MIDRGIIKWQPFNSVVPSSTLLKNNKDHQAKPILFDEELEALNQKILEAYYSHNLIELTIYEENTIQKYESIIIKINSTLNTIYLKNNKTIFFNQIIHIKNI